MDDYTIQQGETLRLTVTVTEEGAATAELWAETEDGDVISNSANFDGMVADLTTNTSPDQPAGEYSYYIKITWDDDSVDILTKREDCDGDECELPVITVCEISSESS